MAQFRGTVKGGRTEASRLGTKSTGMVTTCNGWRVGVTCTIEHNTETDEDEVRAYVTSGSRKYGEKVYGCLGVFTTNKGGDVIEIAGPKKGL